MINYILIDDDEPTLEYVKLKIDTIAPDFELSHIASFNSSKKAYEQAGLLDFDLLIVDYDMPVFNGVELAQRIAKNKKVIFLTSTVDNEQKIVNSVNIIGFLSKPFEIDSFATIVKNKLLEAPTAKQQGAIDNYFLPIGSGGGVQLKLNDTYYISTSRNNNGQQPERNHVHIYGKNDELLFKNVRCTIKKLAEVLASENFEKINQSTMINRNLLKRMDDVHVELYNTKESFKISKQEKLSFLQRLKNKLSK